ncbi:MAG: hypothetical protein ACTSYW_01515 [Candidatus Heimdallarchaeota archaeon]
MAQQNIRKNSIKTLAKEYDRFSLDCLGEATKIDSKKLKEEIDKLQSSELLKPIWIVYCTNCGAELGHYKKNLNGKNIRCNHCEYVNTIDPKGRNFELVIFLTEKGKEFFRK